MYIYLGGLYTTMYTSIHVSLYVYRRRHTFPAWYNIT
jgi:hypothetical protein